MQDNKKNISISIIVPVFKVEKYINKCIDSILSQTFTNFECILVDDCSPDNCASICDDYAERDNRIKVIHKKKNEGLPQGRKSGIDLSAGNYIIFIDGDDWIEPDMLEKMHQKAVETDCDIVISDMFTNIKNEQKKEELPEIYDKILIFKHILTNGRFGTSVCNKLIKREIYLKVYFPIHNYIEDRVITIQTIFYSKNIEYISNAFYHYNKNEESICGTIDNTKKLEDEYYNLIEIINFLDINNLVHDLNNEIIYRVNNFKTSLLKNKKLRNLFKISLSGLYPESTDKLFFNFNYFILFIALNNNSFIYKLIDFYVYIEENMKIFYRLVIPQKIRYSLWEKRNSPC